MGELGFALPNYMGKLESQFQNTSFITGMLDFGGLEPTKQYLLMRSL